MIKSWLDKNTNVHKTDSGRRGWAVSKARDKERFAEGRVAAGRVAARR